MPTDKSDAVEGILTELAGISRQEAAEKKICTWCKKPITPFRDELSIREYHISGLCQKCQDETFVSGQEPEEPLPFGEQPWEDKEDPEEHAE